MLSEITNFYQISNGLATSGMPRPEQFAEIGAAGYQLVINLARSVSPGQPSNEAELVRAAGMDYIHIPVEWEHPQLQDVQQFFSVMDANRERRIFVHCVMNYRVSAFVYLYRVLHLGIPEPQARQDLQRLWTPDGIWAELIEQALDRPVE
jgi:protein tyrosine phosphatase (PTP) superfamily phosphohydrolase (DUF442 family)